MQDQTSHTVHMDHNRNQDEPFARSSGTQSVTAPSAPRTALPIDDDPNPDDPTPPPPEPQLDISIISPADGAIVPVSASSGTIQVQGSILAIGYTVSQAEVQIGGSTFPLPAKQGSWTRTSSNINASGSLTITARMTAKRTVGNFPAITVDSKSTVTIVLADNIKPIVTITQPATAAVQVQEAQGKFALTLQGTAEDAMSGIQKVAYTVNGTPPPVEITPLFPGGGAGGLPPKVNWAANVELPFQLGPQTITISATDAHGNVGQKALQVTTVEKNPPTLFITEPEQGEVVLTITETNGSAILQRLAGTAQDTQSGVQKVEWALDPAPGAAYTLAKPKASGDWSSWSTDPILIPGTVKTLHTIKVRCVDHAGNVSPEQDVNVSLAEQYPPRDPTVQEYFSSLIDFIVRRVTTPTRSLQVADLTAELYQPFQRLLSADATLSQQLVHQIRICIETLRQYLAHHGPLSAGSQQALQQAEAAYRQAAYETLLKRLGTSFAEIRAARLADEPIRQALAQRLGFALRPQPVDDPQNPPTSLRALAIDAPSPRPLPTPGPEPDRLQQLLLPPDLFTEADLETLFGLVDTRRDPLQPPSTTPKVLDWQLQFLHAGWATQDDAAAVPVIDPDVIGTGDLQPNSAAYFVWQGRSIWVNGQLETFKKLRESLGDNLLTGFDTVIKGTLGLSADLLALDAQRLAGADIAPQLAQMQLSLPAFVHLMSLRKLAAAGTILASEWDEVYSILVQVEKRRSFAFWRSEEQAHHIVLGSQAFRLPEAGQTFVPPGIAPEWRMTMQDRHTWQEILRARINQQETVQHALLAVVDATEEDTLPVLRDALVTALGTLPAPALPAGNSTSDRLTHRLLIDISTTGYQKTTRIHQAIQILQELLLALRTKRLAEKGITWVLDEFKETQADFDEELQWIGSYEAWRSAMQVFLYPENLLLPTLRPLPEVLSLPGTAEKAAQTPAFQQLITSLRETPTLTPEQARTRAQTYVTVLKEDYQKRGIQFVPHVFDPLDPLVPSKPFQITDQYTQSDLLKLAQRTKGLLVDGDLLEIPAYLREIFYFVPIALALQLQKSGEYLAALNWFRVVYAYDLPVTQRKIYYGLVREHNPTPDVALTYPRPIFWLKDSLNPHERASTRYEAYTRFVVMSLVRCLLEFADTEFTRDTNESLPRAHLLYLQALDLLAIPELNPPAVPGLSPNPVVASLTAHAQANLAKLRSGRNIAGLQRQLELTTPLALAPAARVFHPTPYRYTVLIDRAKHLVTLAQQVEAAYLAALEKYDDATYTLLKANQDLALAQAGVALQALRVTEAKTSKALADKQKERAEYQVNTYDGFLKAGMNEWERQLLTDYQRANVTRIAMAKLDGALTAFQAMNTASSGGFLGSGIGAGYASASVIAALAGIKSEVATAASFFETAIQEHSLYNSIEQRQQEWTLQLGLAQHDDAISAQQVQLAIDHQNIVAQEQAIAQKQQENAQATVRFLANKFTKADLYEWMSGVLRQVYSYFLQQATSMAKLAQHQLAFERQDVAPAFIQHDYWQPPVDSKNTAADRRGLTGSARLLQDISQLDQFAFETNKRKLQLAKTLSLARLVPLELQRFRDTGMLTFATPMQLFDRDFPGHYLRLIKRVRTSVVALIPPNQGIRATLTTSGVSRVVIGGDTFQTIAVRRDPESVALTSPMNATGLFELEQQSELLLPFEFTGVDTLWHLEMPKAANPFDYRTIADVLFTIEYTALSNLDYRQQVIQQLDRSVSADRPYSFRHQFADQWYDLHNPDQTATPMVVSFTTTREDFPPNLENLTMQQVALYFVLDNGATVEGVTAQLHFTTQESSTPLGGEAAATPEGIISTRLGNASGWMPVLGRAPFGTWELAFPNTAEIRNLFENEVITDIMFVITTSGRTPAWPV